MKFARLLSIVLVLLGCYARAQETLSGRVWMRLDEIIDSHGASPITYLLGQMPEEVDGSDAQPFLELVGLKGLMDLPREFDSGATVSVTGERLPSGNTPRQQFLVSELAVLTPAPPRRLLMGKTFAPESTLEDDLLNGPSPVPGKGLRVLVMRPRLPEDCPVDYRSGPGSVEEWQQLLAKVNLLQRSCTNDQLSYQEPVVTEYIDLPCIVPNNTGCDDDAKDQWFLATAKIVREEFKINTDDFDHVICDFPMLKDCQVGGQGLFRTNLIGYNGWPVTQGMRLDFLDAQNARTIAHEMGHNYGLTHANRLDLGEGGQPPANWSTSYGTDDESALMGYNGVLSCFSYPASAMLGLAKPARYLASKFPAGKNVAVPLKVQWAAAPQGAVFRTGRRGQRSWRIWANYLLATDSNFTSGGQPLLQDGVYNKAVLLHLTSSRIPFNSAESDDFSHVHRVRVLQNGDAFRWEVAGLVFKYVGVSADSSQANLVVCRETRTRKCSLQTTPPPASAPIRLMLVDNSNSSYCLQACTHPSCDLPSPPFHRSLGNVFFTSNCPQDNSTAWIYQKHISNTGRFQNLATGQCLTVKSGRRFLEEDSVDPMSRTYRLALQRCNTLDPPSLRSNRQLFLADYVTADKSVARFYPLLYFPDCPQCGILFFQAVTALQRPSKYLPQPQNGTSYLTAGAAIVGLNGTISQIIGGQQA